MTEERADQEKMAAKIAALLAQAEGEAKAGNEAARDTFLAKASALQLKYAIADAMLARAGETSEAIVHQDFCRESNTPLIKAKRELIASLAGLNRGRAILMHEWQPRKDGKGLKLNRRAYVRVYAHEGDLRFIGQMYTSLLLQMQTMMARDEAYDLRYRGTPAGGWGPWRVSYSFGWVHRVHQRMEEAKRRNEYQEERQEAGTALVLRDRDALVQAHYRQQHPSVGKVGYRSDDNSQAGRARGAQAANEADLGGKKVDAGGPRQIAQ